jgi:hypothetical protein
MDINVTIQIGPGETVPRRSPTRLATEVLQAVDGDPATDTVHVTINASGSIGSNLPAPTVAPNE